jgi:inosine-uridine nucleoside N-ribohydrolase
MARKVILVTDPGLDGAFAVAVALNDPELEVLALAATAGNIPADQATRNVQTLVEQMDPPRWPRLGAAPAIEYDIDATNLHGPNGLGGIEFPCARLHHSHPSDKLIGDLARQNPKEVTVLLLGPATVLARALDRDPELLTLLQRVIMLGGTWQEPGDAGPVTEFHFACDPSAARQVLRSGVPITLIPLDVSRKVVLSPGDLLQLPATDSLAAAFLRRTVPQGISATAGLYGTEGFYLQDVVGVAAASKPDVLTLRAMCADVETRGDVTRGMSIFDTRWGTKGKPNVELATAVDVNEVRKYIAGTVGQAGVGLA